MGWMETGQMGSSLGSVWQGEIQRDGGQLQSGHADSECWRKRREEDFEREVKVQGRKIGSPLEAGSEL